jgi:hypothetical protein
LNPSFVPSTILLLLVGHEFLLSETELDLWRGDMLKTINASVRCLQNDTKPLIVSTKVENNIIVGKPMEPIKFVNYASGGVKSINGIPNIEYTSSRARIERTHIVRINKLTLNYNTTTDTTVL